MDRGGQSPTRACEVVIAGRYVGYQWARISRVGSIAEARVLDAKRGRIVTRVAAFTDSRKPQDSAGSLRPDPHLGGDVRVDRVL